MAQVDVQGRPPDPFRNRGPAWPDRPRLHRDRHRAPAGAAQRRQGEGRNRVRRPLAGYGPGALRAPEHPELAARRLLPDT
jgi:hypothetical protein